MFPDGNKCAGSVEEIRKSTTHYIIETLYKQNTKIVYNEIILPKKKTLL